jgi:cysteine desulfurase
MIYLDYAAATPLDPRVKEQMAAYEAEYGNPSSIHQKGQAARRGIDDARLKCKDLLGAFSVHELIFTAGGTESCNMAIFGAAFGNQDKGKHLVVSAFEHPAVLEPARYLRDRFGFELTEVLPDSEGIVHPEAVEAALRPDTILVSVMLVNNEVGTLQPIKKIAKRVRDRGILFHTDACQGPGYTDVNVDHLGVDLASFNGSKIYGPKGSGLLFVREGTRLSPLIHGGGQEFRVRGGTENTTHIVGFATALELTLENSKEEAARQARLRDILEEALLKMPQVSKVNGSREHRVANNLNVQLKTEGENSGGRGETLVMKLDILGVAASSGSACSSGKTEASHVLLAMGQDQSRALASLRLTLGRFTTEEEIEAAVKILTKALK